MFFSKIKLLKLSAMAGSLLLTQMAMGLERPDIVKFIDNVKEGQDYKLQYQFTKMQGSTNALTLRLYDENNNKYQTYTLYSPTAPEPSNSTTVAYFTIPQAMLQASPTKGSVKMSVAYGNTVPGASVQKWLHVIRDPKTYLLNSEWETRKANWRSVSKLQGARYTNTSGKNIVAYYTEWANYRQFYPKDIPVENLTHINYSFVAVCGMMDQTTVLAEKHLENNPDAPYVDPDLQHSVALVNDDCKTKGKGDLVIVDKEMALQKAGLDKSTPDDATPLRGNFAEFYRMKKTFPHIKIIATIGGWTFSEPFSGIASDPTARSRFAGSIASFLTKYDFFDGVDIDWEYPGGGGLTEQSTVGGDMSSFPALIQEVRNWLNEAGARNGKQYQLSVATGASPKLLQQINFPSVVNNLDRINLMTYDYYGPWNNIYGNHTALTEQLNCVSSKIPGLAASSAVLYLNKQGIPLAKLGLGVASYGQAWEGISAAGPFNGGSGGTKMSHDRNRYSYADGSVEFKGAFAGVWNGSGPTPQWDPQKMMFLYSATDTLVGINKFNVVRDNCATAEYLWNPNSGIFVTLDTPWSVQAKTQYAMSKQLGSVFMWEIGGDTGHLLNKVHTTLKNPRY